MKHHFHHDENVKKRLAMLLEAERRGNVAETCKRHGISRQTFYKWRRRFWEQGVLGLRDRSHVPIRPRKRSSTLVRRVIRHVLAHPEGSIRAYGRALHMPPSTVHRLLKDHGLGSSTERCLYLERQWLEKGALTEGQRKYVLTSNPAMHDWLYEQAYPDWQMNRIWQFGILPLRKTGSIVCCIHMATGFWVYGQVMQAPPRQPAEWLHCQQQALHAIVGAFRSWPAGHRILIAHERHGCLKPPMETVTLPWVMGGSNYPFGMLQRARLWLQQMTRRNLLSGEAAFNVFWNQTAHAGHPFHGRSPRQMITAVRWG